MLKTEVITSFHFTLQIMESAVGSFNDNSTHIILLLNRKTNWKYKVTGDFLGICAQSFKLCNSLFNASNTYNMSS